MGEVDLKSQVIADVCRKLTGRGPSFAAAVLDRRYPFVPEAVTKRRIRPLDYTRVFIRDGFRDRYTGDRLVFAPVLRLLSCAMPDRLPYHPNWRTDVTHPAYWDLGATVDHLVPATRGGLDEPANWMTTSMALNSAKMNWTIAELGWQVHPAGSIRDWDGLLTWSLEYVSEHPEAAALSGIRPWIRAAAAAWAEVESASTVSDAV